MHIGNMLRDIRIGKGLSQKETARKLNMSASTLCRYEKNTRIPGPGFWHTFADIMEVDFEWLWDHVGIYSVADPTEPYGEKESLEPWFKIMTYQEWIDLNEEDLKTIKNIVKFTLSNKK